MKIRTEKMTDFLQLTEGGNMLIRDNTHWSWEEPEQHDVILLRKSKWLDN